jgi:hypothetical protein
MGHTRQHAGHGDLVGVGGDQLVEKCSMTWQRSARIIGMLMAAAVVRLEGQARVDYLWANQTGPVANLTVMIDAGADERCRGAGIVAGYGDGNFYVLTAKHVIDAIQEEGQLDQLGVRFRIVAPASSKQPDIDRRASARLRRSDPATDIAALVIEAPALVAELRPKMDFTVMGDSQHLVPGDQVYPIGCGDGLDWDSPLDLVPVLARTSPDADLIPFASTYLRGGFSGGPLVHVFQAQSLIVGLSRKSDGNIGRAIPLHDALDRARKWNIPVRLTSPHTRPSCRYTVSPTAIALTGEKRGGEVTVETSPDCPWRATRISDALLEEMGKFWLDVTVQDELDGWGVHFGSMTVNVAAGHTAPCDGQPQHGVVLVAGTMVQVSYDGRCTTPPPATATKPFASRDVPPYMPPSTNLPARSPSPSRP